MNIKDTIPLNSHWINKIKTRILTFKKELEAVCRRCSRGVADMKVVYATKYLDKEQFVSFLDIMMQIDSSKLLIGENRVQETIGKINYLREKRSDLLTNFNFVMIGTLQKNKINKALEIFQEIHSVDGLELAEAINKRVGETKLPVFLEINLSGEETKYGFRVGPLSGSDPGQKSDLIIGKIRQLPNLELKGLMTMAPYVQNPEEVRPIFRKLRQLADKYNLLTSMGMSSDWQVAIEEGSDMIRIGSRFFG